MTEYDQRQYGLMLQRLTDFQNGRIFLDILIADLEGLLSSLQSAGTEWKQSFREFWGALEDARAMALFRGSRLLNEQETKVASTVTSQVTGTNGPTTVLTNGQSTYTIYTRTTTGAPGAQYFGPNGVSVKYSLGGP